MAARINEVSRNHLKQVSHGLAVNRQTQSSSRLGDGFSLQQNGPLIVVALLCAVVRSALSSELA